MITGEFERKIWKLENLFSSLVAAENYDSCAKLEK
jgi:hypothetical protein